MIRPRVPWFEAFLLHDGEPDEGRLAQHADGPGVGDRSQTDVIHLGTGHIRETRRQCQYRQCNARFMTNPSEKGIIST